MANHFARHVAYLTLEVCVAHRTNCAFERSRRKCAFPSQSVRFAYTRCAYSKGMLPLDLWCQASLQGLPERHHLGKTVHCWGWSDRIVSWVLGPWRRGWEICTEWGLVAQRLTTDSCPVVTGHIDPQRSPCWLPTTYRRLRLEWAQRWRNLTVAHCTVYKQNARFGRGMHTSGGNAQFVRRATHASRVKYASCRTKWLATGGLKRN